MALWVFGCSFSVSEDATHPTWTSILADKLGFKEYHNFSQWGVSNEYIIDQFMQQQPNMLPRDTIIIQLTERSRQWFFEDQPCISNFYIADLDKHVTKEQHNAVNMYVTHLHRDEIQVIRYALTCMALNHITTVMSANKIMILPGFNHVPGVSGSLLEVCNGEFKSDESRLAWYDKYPIDARHNHMSEKNHYILAEKIFHAFNTGTLLDLTTGFEKRFL